MGVIARSQLMWIGVRVAVRFNAQAWVSVGVEE